jgi:pimeloyl-ACP methyl ester carboxylesterase
MTQRRNSNWLLGLTLGSLAGALAVWVRHGQIERAALVERVEEATQLALRQLGVAAESTFVPVNGLNLHAIVAGPREGRLVVLLHGFPENWYAWSKQIAPLARAGYRVVVPDQRGYNLSDKPASVHSYRLEALASDVRELVRAFDYDRAVVVGHDVGGIVAWRAAMDYPTLIDKLVILNAPHPATYIRELRENPAQQRKSWYVGFFQLPWLPETLLGQSPMTSVNFFFRKVAVNQDAFSSYDLHYLATALSQPGAPAAMINWYRAAARDRAFQRAIPIRTPTLLIWAESDRVLGKSLTYGLKQWVPNLKIHYIPNCGHWVQNEAAEEVNAQLLGFLSEA